MEEVLPWACFHVYVDSYLCCPPHYVLIPVYVRSCRERICLIDCFTANLVVLLHIFVFLEDWFLFTLHFLCIFWVLKMVWTFFPCQLVQQGIVLIVCACGIGQHTPSWILLPVLRLAMIIQQWHLSTFPVICVLWLHHCYLLEFVSFYNDTHFFRWSAIAFDRYFWWALFWFKSVFLVAHFCWQNFLQFFKVGLDSMFAWLTFHLCCQIQLTFKTMFLFLTVTLVQFCSHVHIPPIQHLLHWLSTLSLHNSFSVYNLVHCVWVWYQALGITCHFL